MLTIRKQAERTESAVGRRGGLFMLVAALMLCACLMSVSAHAAESTYLFEVTTGKKTGDEEKIQFFIITYTTESSGNKTVSKFLVPAKDGWEKTYDTLAAVNKTQEERDKAIRDTYGYSGAELKSGKKLFQANSTDQYLFTAEEPIKKITRVQVYAADSGSWNCRALRIFRVEKLGGLYRWNTASSDCYIDFAGDLIAEGSMRMDGNVSWKNDKLISTRDYEDAAGADIALKTSGFSSPARHDLQDNTKKTLTLRFDFADTYGAGLEALGAMSAKANTLKTMGLAETMAVTLYYVDCYGMERQASVPGVLNAAEYAAGLLGGDANKAISGLAQQGESMAISVFLPDFDHLAPENGVLVTLGAEEVKSVLGLTAVSSRTGGDAGTLRKTRIELSEDDSASFVTMAVYDPNDARIEASIDGTTGALSYQYHGDPLYYQPVTGTGGDPLYCRRENKINLTAYEHGKLLSPRDKTERYLLELTTDDVAGAGTKDDILMSIGWTDLEGNVKVSDTINVREMSRDFNGWWYGTAGQDIGYYQGVASGQTLRFFVPLQNVKTITDIKVWMSGEGTQDDWQMRDIALSTVESFNKRAVVWGGVSADGVSSELRFTRTVMGTLVYRYSDTVEAPTLVQQGSNEKIDVGPSGSSIGGGGTGTGGVEVAQSKKVDWSQIRYSMTYRQASQDLGFAKERCLYAVKVNVAGNSSATAEEGDCGSKNLFYFQLVFKNGCSSFVLANQQLPSDGFVAGASQTFYISTNDDYGDVTAVQIIPEDLAENSDMFDKLKIDSIEIQRHSSAALVPVWTIHNVGWINIDYRDEGQMQSITGMAGRGASELMRTYPVDGSTFNVNFMLSVTTESYPVGSAQFEGNLAAIVYYDSYTPSKGYEELGDVTKSMYAYMNRTAGSMPDSVGGKTISDPSLMFRAEHTDRFYFSLNDVRSIKRIELLATSAVNTTWNISDVSLFMVNGEGSLILNRKGEYERVYKQGEGLTELAHGTSEHVPAYGAILQPYDGTVNEKGEKMNNKPTVINVSFTENLIDINEGSKQWTSVVSREPVSENDTLNIFLYPENGKTDHVNGLVTTLQFATARGTDEQRSTDKMSAVVYNGQEVYFATGINAQGFKALNSVTVYGARGGSGISGGSVRAVIRRLRSGVVINTWELAGSGYTDIGGITLTNTGKTTSERQRLLLQLGSDTETALLAAEKNDIAVALYYRSDDPSGTELRSPYVYLTDQGYTQLRPGQMIELDYRELNIAEITGVALVSSGAINASVDGARVTDETYSVETGETVQTKGVYSFAEKIAVAQVPYRMTADGTHTIQPLSLTFATALSAAGDVSAGTGGPVRMTVGYYDRYGDLLQKTYDDIRAYIADGAAGFLAGSTVRVEMLVPDVEELRWIELEPLSEANATQGTDVNAVTELEATRAMWTLDSVAASLGNGTFTKHCDVKQQIVEGTPQRINLADILIAADVYLGGGEERQTVTGGTLSMLIPSGESLRIVPRIIGSYEGFTGTLSEVDAASGAIGMAYLNDTRGYTEESIAARAAEASDSRAAAIWSGASIETGTFEVGKNDVSFTPPRNYTDKWVQYQLRIVSAESDTSVLTISVTVKNEPDPVAQALEKLDKTIEQEKLDQMQQQIDSLNATGVSGDSGSSAGGDGGSTASPADGASGA